MPKLWTALFGTLAFLWLVETVRLLWGMADLARLCDVAPLPDAECPIVSILVAARDEAVGLPQALPTLLEQDYPHYEVMSSMTVRGMRRRRLSTGLHANTTT
jgi:hypothetical protein